MFIEVHPRSKPAEVLLLNVSDIEYAYPNPEKTIGAVIRLHGHGRNTIDVTETYEQLKVMLAEANGEQSG
jgi:hypothetical protein